MKNHTNKNSEMIPLKIFLLEKDYDFYAASDTDFKQALDTSKYYIHPRLNAIYVVATDPRGDKVFVYLGDIGEEFVCGPLA